jgi:L-fuconolactonase
MTIIDTHAHIYAKDEQKYPAIAKPLRPPLGKAAVEDLREAIRASGVRAVCAIQTSTFYRFDNRYILDSAVAHPDWIAGVCTLDPDNPESPRMLADFAKKYRVRGMRSIPAKDGRLDHPGVRALWRTAVENNLVINVLVGREKAQQVDRMLAGFPELPVVLDHCMNLKAGPELVPILDDVLKLSKRKNLHAKLTFVPTGSMTGYPCADMHGPCLQVIQAFGPERCVWGSDFPNDLWTPKVSYAEHLRIFAKDLTLTEAAREQILGSTAKRLWFPQLA